MHLTLRQLQYFQQIVDAGNMTRAADRLHIAPTALSLQVRAMEERLGVGLLERHSRGVRPTPAGAELYRKGQEILAMVDETERLVGLESRTLQDLRLGVPPSALRMIGADAILAGSSRLNGFVIHLVEGFSDELISRLNEGELSFVLACGVKPSNGMQVLELLEEHLVFATSRTHARAGGRVALADALASDLVFYRENDAVWNAVHAAARENGLRVNVAHVVGSLDVIRHMVSRGLATAILPLGIVEEESRRGEVAVHAVEDYRFLRRMSLAWLVEVERSKGAKDCIDFIIEIIADLHARTVPYSRLLKDAPSEAVCVAK